MLATFLRNRWIEKTEMCFFPQGMCVNEFLDHRKKLDGEVQSEKSVGHFQIVTKCHMCVCGCVCAGERMHLCVHACVFSFPDSHHRSCSLFSTGARLIEGQIGRRWGGNVGGRGRIKGKEGEDLGALLCFFLLYKQ